MNNDMPRGLGHAAWTWTCSIDMGMQPGHGRTACTGHIAWAWTRSMYLACSMDMDMRHGQQVHTACPSSCPCCMPQYTLMSMLHVSLHAACPCSGCMIMSMLHVPRHAAFAHAACHSTCCVSVSMLHAHVNVASPYQCYRFKSKQNGHGHVAGSYKCSIDMGM
jgi:hypothetical protein